MDSQHGEAGFPKILFSTKDFFWTWTLYVSAGEFLGFAAPALAGVAMSHSDGRATLMAMVLGGAIEGAILGWSQARVLRRIYPRLSVRRWVMLTSAGASFAWLVGMVPSTFHNAWESWPFGGILAAAGMLSVLLLSSIGVAQYCELRRHVSGAGTWILITVGAWCAGLLTFFLVAPPLWHEGQPAAVILSIGLFAGGLMAMTMAATSGFALARLGDFCAVAGPSALDTRC